MTVPIPELPAKRSTDWYPWATAVDTNTRAAIEQLVDLVSSLADKVDTAEVQSAIQDALDNLNVGVDPAAVQQAITTALVPVNASISQVSSTAGGAASLAADAAEAAHQITLLLTQYVKTADLPAPLTRWADVPKPTGGIPASDLVPGVVVDSELATVAKSGLFNDLTTPSGGIPASKLDVNGIANSGPILAVTGGRINASGDTTGATDQAAIQGALNSGRPVTLNSGQTYYVNDTIYLPSASSLNAQGAIVHLIASKQQPVLATSSQKPSRTVTDAVSTAGSATVTSATAAFTSADIGNTVGIVGASYAGATWYGTITAVASGMSATVSVPAVLAGTNLTMYVYNASARCSDVTINGGWYIRDASPADGRTPGVTAFNSFASNFRRVDRLTIVNTTWQVAQSSGSGGRFTVSVADANDVFIQNTRLLNINGDGVHLTGPINRAAVRDTFGTADDDFCVCNTVDGYTPLITDTEGIINNVTFDGIYPNNAFAAAKYYDNDTAGRFYAQGVTFRTVKGSTYKNPIRIDGAVSGCLVEDVKLTTPLGTASVQINDARAHGVTVRGVTWVSGLTPTGGIVSAGGNDNNSTFPGNSLLVQDITMTRVSGAGGVVLNIGNGTAMRNYTLDGFKSTVDQTELTLVKLNGGGLEKLSIRGVNLVATSGQLVNIASSTTVRNILIDDIVATIPLMLNEPVSNATVYMKLSNAIFTGASVASTRSPLHLDLANTRISTTGGVVNLIGTGANARIRVATTVDQIGAGSAFTKDGSQACSLNGTTLPVDVTTLTPLDGDMVFNKSTGVTFGTGPAVYNAAAAQWRGLYSLTAAAGTATPDTTAPTAPTTATAVAGNAQAMITASGSTDAVGVAGYRVYGSSTGGTALASGASPLTVTGLTNGTAVTFYVAAYDAAGNESARTATNAVTPTAPSNTYPITTQPDFVLNADNATFSGSTLSSWVDSIGGLAYSVPSGRNAPTYSATGVNGKPGIVFTKASAAGLFYGKPCKPEAMTIFVELAPSALGAGNGILQGTDSAAVATNLGVNIYTSSGNAIVGGMQGNTGTNAFSGTTFSTTGAGIIARVSYGLGNGVGTSSAKALTSSLNGGTVGTGNTQQFVAVANAGFTLGGAGTAGSDIVIRKVYVFNTLLSTADQQAMTQWLASQDNITVGTN